jgi:ELWxxDGT repeat protein
MHSASFRHFTQRLQLALATAILVLAAGLLSVRGITAPGDGPGRLVKDINTGTRSSIPRSLIVVDNAIYFISVDENSVAILWKTDGTAAGTIRLANNVFPHSPLTSVHGTVFFKGNGLWKTDGTAAGTIELNGDIYVGCCTLTTIINPFTTSNGRLFFLAQHARTGERALWTSDGTVTGTVSIAEVRDLISELTDVNGVVFFVTFFDSHYDLWRSDGTPAGTRLVKQLMNPSTHARAVANEQIVPSLGEGPYPSAQLVNVNGTLFFTVAYDGLGMPVDGLWKSDGTAEGTVLVKDIGISELTNVGGWLFFSTYDAMHGAELWKSDGTTEGTILVRDINPGANGSYPYGLANINGTLFFRADGGVRGAELWKSDGTTAGTIRVADINPGAGSSEPSGLTDVNGILYFSADDGVHGHELWKSNGTEIGTRMVADIAPGARSSHLGGIVSRLGMLFFSADDGAHGSELWTSDGTAAGTRMVVDIDTRPVGADPTSLTDMDGTLFFSANDGVHGAELWKSDGTALVKDIRPGPDGSGLGDYGPTELASLHGEVVFNVFTGSQLQLWKSDGTTTGTTRLGDVLLGSNAHLTNVNGTLFFAGANTFGEELWRTDGTNAGTALVKDINPGADSSAPYGLTDVNGTLFFGAADSAHGFELWKSDGTAVGTVLVKDIAPGTDSSGLHGLTSARGMLFFFADDGVHGAELWRSDGTAAGTTLVKDIWPGSGGDLASRPADLTNVDGTLFFSASDGTHGNTLWRSDGTAAGTMAVKEALRLIGTGCFPCSSWLTDVNGTLFFVADDGVHGYELWKTDGTSSGTTLVQDILPGADSPFIVDLTNVNGTLLFTARTGDDSRMLLWTSDGTPEGTRPLQRFTPPNGDDLLPVPLQIALSGSSLFFNADDGNTGRELWAIPLAEGVQVGLTAPDLISGAPGGTAAIPLSYLNTGMASAAAITLTATLDPRLVYIDNTAGITPQVSGTTLAWRLPGAGFLGGRDFQLRVRLPDAPLGTRYPVTLLLTTAGQPDGVPAQVDMRVADMHYLPIIQ